MAYHSLTRLAGVALQFRHANPETQREIELRVLNLFNRYPSEKDSLISLWNDWVTYAKNHKCEHPDELLSASKVLSSLLI
jgi:hypothetical protein